MACNPKMSFYAGQNTTVHTRLLAIEDHDHLFFNCNYSMFIWQEILKRLGIHPRTTKWSDVVLYASTHWKSKSPNQLIPCICLEATTYYLWRERNWRAFKHEFKTKDKVLKDIAYIIHDQIKTKWKRDPTIQWLLESWKC